MLTYKCERMCPRNIVLLVLATVLFPTTFGDEHSHEYVDGEEVVMWMNTVGPYHNRQETYAYFSLPFCRGPVKEIGHHHETLGEALQGVELEFSGLEIKFKENVKQTVFCHVEITEYNLKAFMYAIKNHYWYQVYVDDLPVWGVVGEHIEGEGQQNKAILFTHKRIDIGYSGDQIVDVNLTSEKKVELTSALVGSNISFSYEVKWKVSSVSFSQRFDKYLDISFFQHRIHWFSIFNSFMMVIFLVGLVSMIMLRTLRKDYARYSREEDLSDLERDIGDEYGWKQVHGDVFRPPPYLTLFCSLIGTGYQLSFVAFACILLAVMGHLYTQRGSLLSAAIFVYAATSPVCGYTGGALYSRLGGKQWIRQMFSGALLFPLFIASVSLVVDVVAMYYHASRAIPLTSVLVVAGICMFVILPLNMVGTIVGRNLSGQQDTPCRVNTVPRPIPDKKWFMEPWSLVLLGGILPFGSIFIEIYFIFTSFWQYKIYYVFGFMMLVFIIVLVVTVCVTIVCTYFLLNSEDYRWQWTSWGSGASIAIYMYIYSIYYFFFKTKMYGLFQTVFYFSYTAFGSIGIGVMCGTAGYVGASYFVHKIYSTVKID